jgi:hypothetical protein
LNVEGESAPHLATSSARFSQPALPRHAAARRAVLPDLSAQRLGLPPGARYEWDVRGTAPFVDLDAFAAPAPTAPPFYFAAGGGARWAWSRSTRFGFTTR